jgi:outer membrane protein TolC
MKKIIMIFLAFGLSAFGMSYEKFKNHTLKHSKVLQSQTLSVQTTEQENNILLRTSNPILTLEAASFDENLVNNRHSGYTFSASQTIRTSSYMNGIQDNTQASALLRKAFVTQGKAGYIKALETLYTAYVYQNKLLSLLEQEYTLSKKVTHMVKERFENGSDNKVSYLQAKTETLALKTQRYSTRQQINSLYYQLLATAGLRKKVSLEKQFIYSISSKTKNSSKLSPDQQILQAKEKLYQSHLNMNQNSFQSYDLYTGFEKEPYQSIVRVGVNVPLSLHNDRSEERMLAKLKGQQTQLEQEQLSLNVHSQKQMFKASIRELSMQYGALKMLQKDQKSLTALLQEGYKIAQGSLFQLMTAKNRLIQTRKSLLQTHKMINNQKIELRFLQGDYND